MFFELWSALSSIGGILVPWPPDVDAVDEGVRVSRRDTLRCSSKSGTIVGECSGVGERESISIGEPLGSRLWTFYE